MDSEACVRRLERDAAVITGLVNGPADKQMRWKPSTEAWSLLETLNHLIDEEREDFRARLDLILHQPGAAWPPIDPQGWVSERRYNERDPQESIEIFLSERTRSIRWLQELEEPDWTKVGRHPSGLELTASDMLASWVAHDMLHIRQLAELHRQWLIAEGLADVRYAGDW